MQATRRARFNDVDENVPLFEDVSGDEIIMLTEPRKGKRRLQSSPRNTLPSGGSEGFNGNGYQHSSPTSSSHVPRKVPKATRKESTSSIKASGIQSSAVWEVYNNEAKILDTELVKDWTSSLNSLLVFATIFAAVLTAFIIESQKMLQQDPADVMVSVLIFYTNNLANGTHTPYSSRPFEAPSWAVSVNCFFFASLSASIFAALASVVSLQWVAEYDGAVTRRGSSPMSQAKNRQFRFSGVISWKMGQLIAALPLLLYFSVALFFAGVIQWMWFVHRTVGFILLAGAILATAFYLLSTLVAAIFPSAPFRTPVSKLFYGFGRALSSIYYQLRTSFLTEPWHASNHRIATSEARDINAIEEDSGLVAKSLVWLSTHISISPDSHRLLLQLVQTIVSLSEVEHLPNAFEGVPWQSWLAIFEVLGSRYLEGAWKGDKNENMVAHDILGCLRIAQRINPTFYPLWRFISDETEFREAVRWVEGSPKMKVLGRGSERSLVEILAPFDRLIIQGCTEEQHLVMVELACTEIELTTHVIYNDPHLPGQLVDPCLRLIAQAVGYGDERWTLDLDDSEHIIKYKTSWNRATELCINKLATSDSTSVWKLRITIWRTFPTRTRNMLLKRCLQDTETLDAMLVAWKTVYSEDDLLISLYESPDLVMPKLYLLVDSNRTLEVDDVHFLLPLLLLKERPDPNFGTRFEIVNEGCWQIIVDICESIKRNPTRLILLLTGMADRSANLDDMSLWDKYRILLLITDLYIIPATAHGRSRQETQTTIPVECINQFVRHLTAIRDRLLGVPLFAGMDGWRDESVQLITKLNALENRRIGIYSSKLLVCSTSSSR